MSIPTLSLIFFSREKKANFNEASKPRAKRIAHKIEISWTIFLPEIALESQLKLKMKCA